MLIKACLNGNRSRDEHPAILEDTLVLPDGRIARDNAQLVAEAARLTDT